MIVLYDGMFVPHVGAAAGATGSRSFPEARPTSDFDGKQLAIMGKAHRRT